MSVFTDPTVFYAVVTGVLTLIVTVAHSRGVELPILSNILRALGVNPAQPTPPAPQPQAVGLPVAASNIVHRTDGSTEIALPNGTSLVVGAPAKSDGK